MIIDAFRCRTPWQDSAFVDMEHALRVEDTLAHVRLALFLLSSLVVIIDPQVSMRPVGALLLGVMLLYSLAAMVALRTGRVRSPRDVAMLHAVDTAGVLVVLVFTGGAVSPFSTLFLFVLLAAGYRWGQRETWITSATGVVALGAHGVLMRLIQGPTSPDLHIVALRVAFAGFRHADERADVLLALVCQWREHGVRGDGVLEVARLEPLRAAPDDVAQIIRVRPVGEHVR